MPNINIVEVDSTSAGSPVEIKDAVFVPGFMDYTHLTVAGHATPGVPYLCSTIEEFETYFGNKPAKFASAQTYASITGGGFAANAIPTETTPTLFAANAADPGYVYAKELIKKGLPVYYVAINSDNAGADITANNMYKFLAERDTTGFAIWQRLADTGEYREIKFLTTGGYPAFEFYSQSATEPVLSAQSGITNIEFNEAKFIADALEHTPEALKTQDNECVFTSTVAESTVTWSLTIGGQSAHTGITLATSGEASAATYGMVITGTPVNACTITLTLKLAANGSVIATKMLGCANSRSQDCAALIDHTDNPGRVVNPVTTTSVYYSATNTESVFKIATDVGAIYTPWCYAPLYASYGSDQALVLPTSMPASFVYLSSYVTSAQTNPTYLAIAGVTRGIADITGLHINSNILFTQSVAESYQPRNGIAINSIVNVKPFGYLIWSNRTLKNNALKGNLTATSFMNVRNMISDIKKSIYYACRQCMFEQNSDILWINFKAMISETLSEMVAGGGLSTYKIVKGTTTEKAKLVATVKIYPLYAIEDFDITVQITDDDEVQVS